MTELPPEGTVRRKRPRAAEYTRYDDHEALWSWLGDRAHLSGMHTIDGTEHGEGQRERWYINGKMLDLHKGQYVVVEDGRVYAYDLDQMQEFFHLVFEEGMD